MPRYRNVGMEFSVATNQISNVGRPKFCDHEGLVTVFKKRYWFLVGRYCRSHWCISKHNCTSATRILHGN